MADLAQVVPALAEGLGCRRLGPADPALTCPPVEHAIICLLDGLGAELLDAHAEAAPTLARGRRTDVDTVFPTTTPAALASLGTGMLPGAHGFVGASFLLPETGTVLSPLSWRDDPPPLMVQPEPTLFERLIDEGVSVRTVAAPDYRASGLTRSALRGPEYVGATDHASRLAAIAGALEAPGRTLTYVYWPDIDRTGHVSGAGSAAWRAALQEADRLVAGIIERLPANAVLVVTADHGMVNCPPDERVCLEDEPQLMADVRLVAGEPRARHLYVRPGTDADVQRRWRDRLGQRAQVLTREEVCDRGLMGPVEAFAAERMGDLIVVCTGGLSIASSVDPLVSSLLGQHGALTLAELRIPTIWFDTAA